MKNIAIDQITNLSDRLLLKISKLEKESFKKSRKLSAKDIIFQNLLSVNNSRHGATESFCTITQTKNMTSQAFYKAGTKIKPNDITELSEIVIEECYNLDPVAEQTERLPTSLKSLKIVAVDGSIGRISKDIAPNREQIEREGLETEKQKLKRLKKRKRPVGDSEENFELVDSKNYRHGLIMSLYDVVRGIPLHSEWFYSLNERKAFLSLLPFYKPKTLFVFDRGFYRHDLAQEIEAAGCYYLFRLQSNEKICALEGEDVDVPSKLLPSISGARKMEYTLKKKIIVSTLKSSSDKKIKIETVKTSKKLLAISKTQKISTKKLKIEKFQEKYQFVTNVHRNILSIDNLPDLYHSRWSIEEFYKLLKHTFGGTFYNNKSFGSLQKKLYFQQLAALINQYSINVIEKERANALLISQRNNKPVKIKDTYPISKKNTADNHSISLYFCILSYDPKERIKKLNYTIYRISNYCHNKVRPFRSYMRKSINTMTSKW